MRSDIAAKIASNPFKIALVVFFVAFAVYLPSIANAYDFSFPPTIPSPYTDYMMGCATGNTYPCTVWDVTFFNSSTILRYGTNNNAVGSGALVTDDTDYPNMSANGSTVVWISGVSAFYPCYTAYATCSTYSGGGSLEVTSGSVTNTDSTRWFASSRDVRDQNGNLLYLANTPPAGSGIFENTHIVFVSPSNGTTTASTTSIGAEVYINTNDLSSTTAYDPQLQMTITSPDNGTNLSFFFPSASTNINTAGNQFFSSTTTLPDGLYNVTTALSVPPFGSFPGQSYDATTTNFIVNESAFLSLQSGALSLAAPTTTCSFSDLSGCFQNALVYLFWPNQASLNSFSAFQSTLMAKPPAGYFLLIQQALTSATTSSPTSTIPWTLNMIDFFQNSPLANVRTGLAALVWFFFLIEFWHRLRNIHI